MRKDVQHATPCEKKCKNHAKSCHAKSCHAKSCHAKTMQKTSCSTCHAKTMQKPCKNYATCGAYAGVYTGGAAGEASTPGRWRGRGGFNAGQVARQLGSEADFSEIPAHHLFRPPLQAKPRPHLPALDPVGTPAFDRLNLDSHDGHLSWAIKVGLISLILEYRGVFERIYILAQVSTQTTAGSPSRSLGVNTKREQTCWDGWDKVALRRII